MAKRTKDPEQPPPPLPEEALSRWHVVRLLTTSGQAGLYICKRRSDGADGVLKVLLDGDAVPERFVREISLLRSVPHESLVPLLDADDGPPPWLVTPLGRPLEAWWQSIRSQSTDEETFRLAQHTILGLARAVAYLHQRNIIHRDIKPENCIVLPGPPERVVLIDLGVAFVEDDRRLTDIDGRTVKNDFATPPAATYGKLEEPPPWWDCLGLAYLWGWMLAERHRRSGPVHWKFHRLIPHPTSESVRALMASCSTEATGPRDGSAFIELARRLGLHEEEQAERLATSRSYDGASAAMLRARRDAAMREATKQEAVSASAMLVGRVIDEICGRMSEEVRVALSNDLAVVESRSTTSGASDVMGLLDNVQPGGGVSIYQVEGAPPDGRPFTITLWIRYRSVFAGYLPVIISWETQGVAKRAHNEYVVRADGTLCLFGPLSPFPVELAVGWATAILAEPGTWEPSLV